MFCFNITDLKASLEMVTADPNTRRSLVGLYHAKDYLALGRYLEYNKLGYITNRVLDYEGEDPVRVYIYHPYSLLLKINNIISNIKRDLENRIRHYSYYTRSPYAPKDFTRQELDRVYSVIQKYQKELDFNCVLINLAIKEYIIYTEFQNELPSKVPTTYKDLTLFITNHTSISVELRDYLLTQINNYYCV